MFAAKGFSSISFACLQLLKLVHWLHSVFFKKFNTLLLCLKAISRNSPSQHLLLFLCYTTLITLLLRFTKLSGTFLLSFLNTCYFFAQHIVVRSLLWHFNDLSIFCDDMYWTLVKSEGLQICANTVSSYWNLNPYGR